MRLLSILLSASAIIFCAPLNAQTITTREVASGLTIPWEIQWGPDGWIWMTERKGRISRVHPETGEIDVVYTIPDVAPIGESGLLGMVVRGSDVYVVYTRGESANMLERLVRYRYVGSTLVDPTILIDSIPAGYQHSGSRLVITPDDKLLMTTGDWGTGDIGRDDAQLHTSIHGKVLRMNLDGSVASDNPFVNAPYPANYIWTTGHRNAQGLVIGPSGIVYASEHGPITDDEINIIEPARNYGWPHVAGYCDQDAEIATCADSSVVEPIRAWTPTIATAGLDYYYNARIPAWRHALVLTTLKESDVRVLKLAPDGRSIIGETIYDHPLLYRTRDLCIAPDGRVFVATAERLLEVTPYDGAVTFELGAPTIEAARVKGGEPYAVRFSARGAAAPDNQSIVELVPSKASSPTLTLGTTSDTGTVSISGTFPCLAPDADTSYRLRVRSINPIREALGPSVVLPRPIRAIIDGSTERICEGDSLLLTGIPGVVNRWSTGETTTSIWVTTAGDYSLEINDGACTTTARRSVQFLERPRPEISWIAQWGLFAAPGGFPEYQWLLDGVEIAGATGMHLAPTTAGRYSLRVRGRNGCYGESNAIDHVPSGIEERPPLAAAPAVMLSGNAITVAIDAAGPVEITVTDMRGSTVRAMRDDCSRTPCSVSLGTEGLSAGAYVVSVRRGEQRWESKVIVE